MAIQIYSKDSDEHRKLELAALVVYLETGFKTEVKDIWFDAGQDWWWSTLVTSYKNSEGYEGTYQMLYPKQHEQIVEGEIDDVVKVAKELAERHLGHKWGKKG